MDNIKDILLSVDWEKNIRDSFTDSSIPKKMQDAALRFAVWSKQLETIDEDNPAICFVREAQISAQQSSALIGLCIYKASAATTRTFFETALYYSYFRTHLDELATLTRDAKYYVSKVEVLEFHKMHTLNFKKSQQELGLVSKIESWYSKISAVVHGQVPGAWTTHSSLANISYSAAAQNVAVNAFIECESIVHELFLCTVGKTLWASFSPDAKSFLLKGMPANKRNVLGLDLK